MVMFQMYLNLKRGSMIKIKKGQTAFQDIFYVLGFMLAAALLIFILYFVFNQIKPGMNTALLEGTPKDQYGNKIGTYNVTKTLSQVTSGVGLFNGLYPLLIIGLIFMVLVSAATMESHPIFFFVSIVVLLVAVISGVVFSNVYQQITTDTQFGNTSSSFGVMNAFMKYLPFIIIIILIIAMVIMYSKPGGVSSRL